MAILEKTVFVTLVSNQIPHYENLGYLIPRSKNSQGRLVVPRGTQIEVKVEDLPPTSHTKLTKICDYCYEVNDKKTSLSDIIRQRGVLGIDVCGKSKCLGRKKAEVFESKPIPIGESLAEKFPNILIQWHPTKNIKSPWNVYPNSNKNVWWACEKGHEWEATPNNRSRQGKKCPYCTNVKVCIDNCLATLNPEILKEWDYDKNKDITPHDVIPGSELKVWWICSNNECCHEWSASIYNRTKSNGSGCPQCVISHGERRVRDWLLNNNINFEPQFTFNDLIGTGGGLLRFDFAVLDGENNVKYLIEYDGEFHFSPIFDGDNYKTLKLHDEMKNTYCIQNNIPLIRIPYWEFDRIEEILEKQSETFVRFMRKI